MELLFINPGPCPGFRGRLSDQFRDERSISVLSGRYWILTVDLEFRWRGPSEDRAGEPGPATPSMVRHSRHYCRLISKLPAVKSVPGQTVQTKLWYCDSGRGSRCQGRFES